MQRVLVQVPVSEPFICPECSGKLRPPGLASPSPKPSSLPVLLMAVLLVAMGGSLSAGYMLGRLRPVIVAGAKAASSAALSTITGAAGDLGNTAPPVVHPAAAPRAPAPPPPPPPILVSNHPYPAHAPSVDAAAPPTHLPHEARFGRVTIDCVLDAVAIRPACHVADIRGGDAFSAASLAFLQGLAVDYPPAERGVTKVPLEHRWRVVFEDFSGVPK